MDESEISDIIQTNLNISVKQEQLQAINLYFVEQKDTIFIAPTGFGKSLLYLAAPFLYDHDTEFYKPQQAQSNKEDSVGSCVRRLTYASSSTVQKNAPSQFLIVMPLVSMIEDAITNIHKNLPKLSAIHLSAATTHMCRAAVFIFTSPESILDGSGRKVLQEGLNVKTVFIDEFHIVEQWGAEKGKDDSFRSAYGRLNSLHSFLKSVPFVCMSATASDDTIHHVNTSLNIVPNIFKVSINKKNIIYHTVRVTGNILADFKWLCDLINSRPLDLPRMMIFFTNINTLVDAYQYITLNTHQPVGSTTARVVMYHLITDSNIKSRILADLGNTSGHIKVSLCSSSLSMGLNLRNIEYVIHYGVPTTAGAFLQESGRASRECEVVAHSIVLTYPKMANGRKLDQTMKTYVQGKSCLRKCLLAHFGCDKPSEQQACCDVCDPDILCHVKTQIVQSYDSSFTDSFSDSLSVASFGDISCSSSEGY